MSGRERYVVIGLAHARSPWFGEVARWATAASLPIEFVKCVSVEEVRARLRSGRTFSAALLDAGVAGVDRDLADLARTAGCAVFVVDDGRARRNWSELGASVVLPAGLTRNDLLGALSTHASTIGRGDAAVSVPSDAQPHGPAWHGSLVAVTGVPGAGTSVVASALAQGLGDDPRHRGLVVLADLALDADQAVLHDAGDIVPGFPELVDAHRLGSPPIDDIRAMTFAVADRGYALLLGLRRPRDWASLRQRSVDAALDGLQRAYRIVVADITPDLDGEAQCGSTDVEDRNLLARTVASRASIVVAVTQPGPTRIHRATRLLGALAEHGVDLANVVLVVNRAPRNPRARADITGAVAELTRPVAGAERLPSPMFVTERRRLDELLRDGQRLPTTMVHAVTNSVARLLAADASAEHTTSRADLEPAAVRPGSLATYADDWS